MNLSLADLDRVRQALKLLSEEPAVQPEQTAALDDAPVSSSLVASPPAALSTESDDETDTTPLPVILPGMAEVPRPEPVADPRGPFEPAQVASSVSTAVPAADTAVPARDGVSEPERAAEPAEAKPAAAELAEPEPADKLSRAAAEKLDQIKDLLITAEAIGEANLDRHFERVSQRQRELIREFFEKAIPGQEPKS